MSDDGLKHKKKQEAVKWVPSAEELQALQNIKALRLREIEEGRADSAISRFIGLVIDEVEKISQA